VRNKNQLPVYWQLAFFQPLTGALPKITDPLGLPGGLLYVALTSPLPQPSVRVYVTSPVCVIVPKFAMSRVQTTLSLMSLVSGGWMKLPYAVNCPAALYPSKTNPPEGCRVIATSCWLRAQLGWLINVAPTTIKTAMLNHFPFMDDSWIFKARRHASGAGLRPM